MPHILVAHTGIGARTLLRIVFERMRYPTEIVASPAEALSAASQHPPNLAILDLAYDSMSGFDLAAELRALYPNLPIMIFTSHGQDVPPETFVEAEQKDISIHTHGPTMDFTAKVRSFLQPPP